MILALKLGQLLIFIFKTVLSFNYINKSSRTCSQLPSMLPPFHCHSFLIFLLYLCGIPDALPSHPLNPQLWGLCVCDHHLPVTFCSVSSPCLSVLPVSVATRAWAMDIPPGLHYGVNNQAFFSSAVCWMFGLMCWRYSQWVFIATPGSLPGELVHYLGSDMYIWSLRFSHLECNFCFSLIRNGSQMKLWS